MNIEYRVGKIEDLDDIEDLVRQAVRNMEQQGINQWDDMYPIGEDFQKDIEEQNLFVGTYEGKIVAICTLNKEVDEEYEKGLWENPKEDFLAIHRLCVNPTFQNMGIAKNTMKFIEKIAVSKEIRAIRLDVFSKNPYALKLYNAFGYINVGTVQWRKGKFFLMEKYLW